MISLLNFSLAMWSAVYLRRAVSVNRISHRSKLNRRLARSVMTTEREQARRLFNSAASRISKHALNQIVPRCGRLSKHRVCAIGSGMFIVGLGTATPPYRYTPSQCWDALCATRFARFAPLLATQAAERALGPLPARAVDAPAHQHLHRLPVS
jgi:hypothetical protein